MTFKDKVVYQIYPKSFMDTNNDGFGDLNGITKKLGYLSELGVDYLWITPFFKSPQNDNGYDVSDYYEIDERFGTMDDFENLCQQAKKYEIKIILDMVLNHTSTEHHWFQEALKGNKKYQDYYIFKKSPKIPTNWISKFGGSTWEYVSDLDLYYLHLFDKTQADLNWDNEEVRLEMANIVNFWMEKGASGFRFDVINLISKPEEYHDDFVFDGRRFYTDGPNVHKYLKELNLRSFSKIDGLTVGEMSSTTVDNCIKYSNPENNELSMTFSFHHLKVDYLNGEKWQIKKADFKELKSILVEWQEKMEQGGGWNALFFNNHDQPRAISRFFNDQEFRYESSCLAATLIHMLRGTPYIYQGEEIGMTNAYFDDINTYRDVESLNYYQILKKQNLNNKEIMKIIKARSRDNSRTPMQWDNSKYAGFSKVEPWLSVIDNYQEINTEQDRVNEKSIFRYYQELIKLRKNYQDISEGSFKYLENNPELIFAFERGERFLVVLNLSNQKLEFDFTNYQNYQTILSNYNNPSSLLNEYEARVLIKNKGQ